MRIENFDFVRVDVFGWWILFAWAIVGLQIWRIWCFFVQVRFDLKVFKITSRIKLTWLIILVTEIAPAIAALVLLGWLR